MDIILAYIDPGSGSLLIQALIAGIVAVPIFFRRQITQIVHTLRGERLTESAPAARRDDTGQDG